MSQSLLMPRGVTRVCVKACGYTAFTLHTGDIPCTTPGCDGYLTWPEVWPHVCNAGHGQMIDVLPGDPPSVPPTDCQECQNEKTAKNAKTRRVTR